MNQAQLKKIMCFQIILSLIKVVILKKVNLETRNLQLLTQICANFGKSMDEDNLGIIFD